MARPPKDPNPVPSTGGVGNPAIFTGDWNSLITDYTSQTDTALQSLQSSLEITGTGAFIAKHGLAPPNGGFGFREAGGTVRRAMIMQDGPPIAVNLGDPALNLNMIGTKSFNLSMPWADFKIDTDATVTAVGQGKIRYNATVNEMQGCVPNGNNIQLWKSFCQLWETGNLSPSTGANAISFTNPQKDANYFVVLELDDGGSASALVLSVRLKTNTGFSIDVSGTPVLESINWFAVRYGA